MNTKQISGLKANDFKRLLQVPEHEVVGEIIRLNCTSYSNGLDVIRVCTLLRERRNRRH